MKAILVRTLFVSMILSLCGCSGDANKIVPEEQLAIDQVAAPFAQGAITVNITAEPNLNAWNEIANSCTVLIIQAEKASVLNRVLSNPAQLKTLFNGAGSENDILKVDRYAAMPGQQTTLHIDRNQNTRSVAIVAGYYPFPTKQHMAMASIPVDVSSTGWWTKTWSAQLSPLILDVTLGSQSITRLKKNSAPQDILTNPEAQFTQDAPDNAAAPGEK